LEDAVTNGNKRASREGKKHVCTGGHVDLTHPTTLKTQYRPNNDRPKNDSCNDNDSKQSPSKSPKKKKIRRPSVASSVDAINVEDSGEESDRSIFNCRRLFANEELCNDDDGSPSNVSSQSASRNVMTYVTPAHDNLVTTDEVIEYINDLEERNVTLILEVDILTAEIVRLKGELAASTGDDDGDDEGKCEDKKYYAETERKSRVHDENTKLSRQLSFLIHNFVTSSELANRSKFPTRRLAKIVVDSILSFEWTHSEVAKFVSRQTTHGDGDKHSIPSMLSTFLNVELQRFGDKGKAAKLVDCIMWDDTFLHGEVKACMIERVRQHVILPSLYLGRFLRTPYPAVLPNNPQNASNFSAVSKRNTSRHPVCLCEWKVRPQDKIERG
jgi:hypothetical protein